MPCQSYWPQSGVACPNSSFCPVVCRTVPMWDYNAGSERVAHPDRKRHGESRVVPSCTTGWVHLWLSEQSKLRACEGGLQQLLSLVQKDTSFPSTCPTTAAALYVSCHFPAGLQAGTVLGIPRSCGGRQGSGPGLNNGLLQQQHAPIPAPTGQLAGCRVPELLVIVMGAAGLQSHNGQVLVWGTQTFLNQRNKQWLVF